jgi:hypothetical protein
VRRAGLLALLSLAVFAATARGAASPTDSSGLPARADRVAGALLGWSRELTTLKAATCKVPVSNRETSRYAPSFLSPKGRPQEQVNVTLARWPSAAVALEAQHEATSATRRACVIENQKNYYLARYSLKVGVTASGRVPSWMRPLPPAPFVVQTYTVTSPVHAPLHYTIVQFIDRADPRVTWAIGFGYSGTAPRAPAKTILVAALG